MGCTDVDVDEGNWRGLSDGFHMTLARNEINDEEGLVKDLSVSARPAKRRLGQPIRAGDVTVLNGR